MIGKPVQMSERLRELIEKARHHKMTPEEKFEQRVSFVYGQQDHDKPGLTKDEIRQMLIHMEGRPPIVADDATVERVTLAIAHEVYGPKFDPFLNPESYEWYRHIAKAAIAAMREDG